MRRFEYKSIVIRDRRAVDVIRETDTEGLIRDGLVSEEFGGDALDLLRARNRGMIEFMANLVDHLNIPAETLKNLLPHGSQFRDLTLTSED